MSSFFSLLGHDLRLEARLLGEWAALVLFFLILILLLPFAIGPDPEMLRRLAPGLIWLSALLMSLLALDKLFIADARDGTLDLMLLSPLPLPLIILSKLSAQTMMMLCVLALMLLPAMILLDMDIHILPMLALTLLLGVPVLVLLGGMAGAMTVGLPRHPAFLTLLLVPFYIPVLIFAVAACDAAALQASTASPLLLLGALFALLLPTAPFVIAMTLKEAGS